MNLNKKPDNQVKTVVPGPSRKAKMVEEMQQSVIRADQENRVAIAKLLQETRAKENLR